MNLNSYTLMEHS